MIEGGQMAGRGFLQSPLCLAVAAARTHARAHAPVGDSQVRLFAAGAGRLVARMRS